MKFEYDTLVVHCSDTNPDVDVTVEHIDSWHKQRGFDCIGYHYVIYRNGLLVRGRPDDKQGAHVRGHNKHTLGVCLIGGKGGFDYTAAQLLTLSYFSYNDRLNKFVGHRDLDSNKECPWFDVGRFFKTLKGYGT